MEFSEMRQEVFDTTMLLVKNGLIRLSAGNISIHDGNGHVAITPAGLRYDRMVVDDIPILDLDGNIIDGNRKPSSETPMHTAIYREIPSVGGVVHTHSVYGIAFASSGTELPVICIEVLSIGGPVPVAPYTCPGSKAAGEVSVKMFKEKKNLKTLMLRNHGLISIGPCLYDAYQNAYKFEIGAEVFHKATSMGTPISFTDEQIEEVYRLYRSPSSDTSK